MAQAKNKYNCPDRDSFETLFLNYAPAQKMTQYMKVGSMNYIVTVNDGEYDPKPMEARMMVAFSGLFSKGNDLDKAMATIQANSPKYTGPYQDGDFQTHLEELGTAYKSLIGMTHDDVEKSMQQFDSVNSVSNILNTFATAIFKIEMYYKAQCANSTRNDSNQCPLLNSIITFLGKYPEASPYISHFYYFMSIAMFSCVKGLYSPTVFYEMLVKQYTSVYKKGGELDNAWATISSDPVALGDCFEEVKFELPEAYNDFQILFKDTSTFFYISCSPYCVYPCPQWQIGKDYDSYVDFQARMEKMIGRYQSACIGDERDCTKGDKVPVVPFDKYDDIHTMIAAQTHIANLQAVFFAQVDLGHLLGWSDTSAQAAVAKSGSIFLNQVFGEKAPFGIALDDCMNDLAKIPTNITTDLTKVSNCIKTIRDASTKSGMDFLGTDNILKISTSLDDINAALSRIKIELFNIVCPAPKEES